VDTSLLSKWKRAEGARSARTRPVAYKRVLVPLGTALEAEHAMVVACRLAADRGAVVTALSVIEIPTELPLAAQMVDEEAEAHLRGLEARAIAQLYGVSVTTRLRRARLAGEAIVEEAVERRSEIIVIGAPRRPLTSTRRTQVFGKTVDFVLKNAPCRIVVAGLPRTT
jgi:nucleotide-binding universal stress UspA family protein